MSSRLAILLAITWAGTGCASDLCGRAENNAGGYAKASLDSADVVAAADFAARSLADADETPAYELICAQTQVVSGTNYRLGMDLEDATWRAVVYEDHDGTLELTESIEDPE